VLRELAHTHGVTVVASIHQPSSQVFALFDSLLLLKAGLTLYHGPRAAAADRFGALLGKARPPDFSAADWLMEVLVLERCSTAQELLLRAEAEAAAESAFESAAPVRASAEASSADAASPPPTWAYQVRVLGARAWRLARGSIWVHEVAALQLCIGLLVCLPRCPPSCLPRVLPTRVAASPAAFDARRPCALASRRAPRLRREPRS